MKVQELIDRLADFRGEADVVFWQHNSEGGYESKSPILGVNRDTNGLVGINWSEDARSPAFYTREITDE